MMRVGVIVQARMGSMRLPGKVLKPILGKPMLDHQLDRLERVKGYDQLIVATTTRPEDAAIVRLVKSRKGIDLFRGADEDVLSRYYGAAYEAKATVVVRITADCPLIDPDVVSRCIRAFMKKHATAAYVSNCRKRTFPRGLDTEVFSFAALEAAHKEGREASDREHVTPFIWKHPERFPLLDILSDEDHSDLRWTVDTGEDFELISKIYEAIYPVKPDFLYEDILNLYQTHPEWRRINAHVQQIKN